MSIVDIIEENKGIPLNTEITIENKKEDKLVFQELFANKDKYIGNRLIYNKGNINFKRKISRIVKHIQSDDAVMVDFIDGSYIWFPSLCGGYPYKITIKEKENA